MSCSCVPGCACAGAAACSGSACIGSGFAGANIGSMGLLIGGYHSMWYPQAPNRGKPTAEEREEIRAEMRERDTEVLRRLRGKLAKIESEAPRGLIRTEHHLDREKGKLQERIRRLEHEVSLLEG